MDNGREIAAVLDAEDLMPVGSWRHVVPGFEGRGECADIRVSKQHGYFERLQALVAQIIDSEHGSNFLQDFLKTRLLRLEAPLQGAATKLQRPAGGVRIGFSTGHQVCKFAF